MGNVVKVAHGQADVEEKPEVRHAGGVYYTPRFVVDSIIRRVVGPQITGRSPIDVLNVKILDPACGSGSFLVAAFQYLIDHCVAAITADPSLASVPATPKARKKRKEIAFKDKQDQWQLAPDFKAALLTNCIHGVDIDQQAVEVTVMSLYLKMLEGKLPPNWQKDWLENELLPSLDNNILCGNSLINSADFDRWVTEKHGGLFPDDDDDLRFRMNRFDWSSRTRGFGRLLDSQSTKERGRDGFDCIIGNPPYIRVQELNKWAPDECEFYRWRYQSATRGNYDIYVVFIERCLELLATNGLLGFIMPHKFWQARYGEAIRRIVVDGRHLRSLIDFTDQQVFRGATTYTAIHVFGRSNGADFIDYARVFELNDGVTQCGKLDAGEAADGVERFNAVAPRTYGPWGFRTGIADEWCNAVSAGTTSLGELANIFVGVQTSADNIYHLDVKDDLGDKLLVQSRADRIEYSIEKTVLHPIVSGADIRALTFDATRQVILFPYEWTSVGRTVLYSEEWLSENVPNAWAYLKSQEKYLRQREGNRFDHERWYQFGRAQNIGRQQGAKLCVPRLAERLRCAFDVEGEVCLDNVDVNGIRFKPDAIRSLPELNYFFLAGILNSKLAETFIRATVSTHFRGGFASYNRQFIEVVPIKLPETANEKKRAARIVDSVRAIMAAKVKLRDDNLSDRQRNSLQSEVEQYEGRIDEAVFQLYGVTALST